MELLWKSRNRPFTLIKMMGAILHRVRLLACRVERLGFGFTVYGSAVELSDFAPGLVRVG
eukprot:2689251-Rhodomonas_salina.1